MQNFPHTEGSEIASEIKIKEVLFNYLAHWKWYLLCVAVFLIGVNFYMKFVTPKYGVAASIMLKDEKGTGEGTVADELAVFTEMNAFSNFRSNMKNELIFLKSNELARKVVKELGLDFSYFVEGRLKKEELYKNLPITLNYIEPVPDFDRKTFSFVFRRIDNNTFAILDSKKEHAKKYFFGEKIKTQLGTLVITKSFNFSKFGNQDLIIGKNTLLGASNKYSSRLTVENTKKSKILVLSYVDNIQARGLDYLNALINVYNEDAIEDRNIMASSAAEFINKRLELISNNLDNVEEQEEKYKKENQVVSFESNARLQFGNATGYENQVIETEIQINLLQSVLDDLSKYKEDQAIPANILSVEGGDSGSVSKYNELILSKKRLLKTALPENPTVIKIDEEIKAMRKVLTMSMTNTLNRLKIKKNEYQKLEDLYKAKVGDVPTLDRKSRSIGRQQKIIESLYLYLLQKREEIQISLAITTPKAKVVDSAYTTGAVSQGKMTYYLMALLIGLLLPTLVIFLREY
ncbi:MAG: GumC family protein, partial [Flavobacterium sp.]